MFQNRNKNCRIRLGEAGERQKIKWRTRRRAGNKKKVKNCYKESKGKKKVSKYGEKDERPKKARNKRERKFDIYKRRHLLSGLHGGAWKPFTSKQDESEK